VTVAFASVPTRRSFRSFVAYSRNVCTSGGGADSVPIGIDINSLCVGTVAGSFSRMRVSSSFRNVTASSRLSPMARVTRRFCALSNQTTYQFTRPESHVRL